MPPRRTPTLRQRRLGAELRKMREYAGLGGTQLARNLGLDPAQITQMESGKIGVSAERLRSFAAACKCMNQPLVDALADMTAERGKGWWEEYRGIIPVGFLEDAELEKHARSLRMWVTTHIPGPCQIGRYASEIFGRVIPPLPRHEVDARTAFRVQRKNDLRRDRKPLEAFIYESALWTRFGGAAVLNEQLGALLEDSEEPWMTIRVVPFATDTFPGAVENLTCAMGPIPDLDTIEVESSRGPIFFDARNELESYRAIFDRTEAAALSVEASRDIIHKIRKQL